MVTTVCLRFSTEDLWVRRSSAINVNDHRYLSIQRIRWLQQKQKRNEQTCLDSRSRVVGERASDVDEYTCEFQWTPVLHKIRMHPMRCLMKGGTMMSL